MLIKNIIVILLASLYSLGIVNVSVSLHFCGGEFEYVTLFRAKEKKSCCGNVPPQHGCCNDKLIKYKVDDQQLSKTILLSIADLSDHAATNIINYIPVISYPVKDIYRVSHSPPLISSVKLHILNCVYLI